MPLCRSLLGASFSQLPVVLTSGLQPPQPPALAPVALVTRHPWQAPPARQRRRRPPPVAPVRASVQRESPLAAVQELFGATANDPGHWNLSPEWWGTQNGGWGRSEGETVFAATSKHGNGRVAVTAHECSRQEGPPGSLQEWRVLRFNDVTRQSVAKLTLTPPPEAPQGSSSSGSSSSGGLAAATAETGEWVVEQQADCLAPEYLKSAASLVAALIGLQGLLPRAGALGADAKDAPTAGSNSASSGGSAAAPPLRLLCIGLGGGSLPLFIAHHFPRALVDAAELDPVVVAAATLAMGLPTDRPNLRLHTADAFDFVAGFVAEAGASSVGQQEQQQGQQQQWQQWHYDLVFLDAFDGEDNVPQALCSPEFARLLAAALHPQHGTLIVNMHAKPPPPTLLPGFILKSTAPPEIGYDPASDSGRRILEVAATFGAALRGAGGSVDSSISSSTSSSSAAAAEGGSHAPAAAGPRVFTVAVQRQLNVEVVVARGLPLARDKGGAARELREAAVEVSEAAGYRFPAGVRASRGFSEL